MKKILQFRLFAVIFLMIMLASNCTSFVYAESTANAKELIDLSRQCSLTLQYKSDDMMYEGMKIELFKIADFTSDLRYTPSSDFAGYNLELNGILSQDEWKTAASTVGAYIIADSIEASKKSATDENGIVSFNDLKPGLYYVRWTGNAVEGNISGFDSFLISLPTLDNDGLWIYDVKSYPKAGGNNDKPTEDYMRVIKLWKDHSDKNRPESVAVEIFCDGKHYQTLTLTAENNWMYTWKNDGQHIWTAVERLIPEKYTVTVEQKGNDIIITNTTVEAPPNVPETGDRTPITLYLILIAVSGVIMVIFGTRGKKDKSQ